MIYSYTDNKKHRDNRARHVDYEYITSADVDDDVDDAIIEVLELMEGLKII